MKKTAPPSTLSENAFSVQELFRHVSGWRIDAGMSQHSPRTIGERKLAMSKFFWFLQERDCQSCGVPELRQFFDYLNNGHNEPGGQWGNPRQNKPLRPVTIATYHKHLRTFYNWMVNEDMIDSSPMERIRRIVARPDQIQPFTRDQVQSILEAAKRSNHRKCASVING